MNKEIKFRAFVKPDKRIKTGRMIYQYGTWRFDSEYDTLNFDFPSEWKENLWMFEGKGYPIEVDGDSAKFELMQYVGLKDSKNKEVYERDIVKYEIEEGKFVIGEITYRHCRYFIDFDIGSSDLGGTSKFIEVIGNVFEHSELLKEQND